MGAAFTVGEAPWEAIKALNATDAARVLALYTSFAAAALLHFPNGAGRAIVLSVLSGIPQGALEVAPTRRVGQIAVGALQTAVTNLPREGGAAVAA